MYDLLRDNFPQDKKLAVSITGGGLQFFDNLVSQGGTSRFFAYGKIPYGTEFQPQVGKSVSEDYIRAELELLYDEVFKANLDVPVARVAASFSLMKNFGHEREDRINHGLIGIEWNNEVKIYTVVFLKQFLNTRELQEKAAATLVAKVIYRTLVDPAMPVKVDGSVRVVNSLNEA